MALALIVPFFVPVRELPDLVSTRELARPDSEFVSVPFPGTDGIEVHYVERASVDAESVGGEFGSADPAASSSTFVLLHGSMFSLSTWDVLVDDLAAFGRVVAYDQLPYGLSEKVQPGDWEGESPYTQDAATRQLIAFLDALELERVTLVGHSYGGTLAARAAIEYPDRVDALILVAPAVYQSESMPTWLMGLPQVRRIGPLVARSLATSEAFFEMCYADPDRLWTEEKAAATTTHTRVTGWDTALWAYLEAWNSADTSWVAELPSITAPTLVIAGSEDSVVPADDSERVATTIRGAAFEIFENVGHVPYEEVPRQTVDTISGWLAKR